MSLELRRRLRRRRLLFFLLEEALYEEEQRELEEETHVDVLAVLALMRSRMSIRMRHYYTADSLVAPGNGTAWDHMFQHGDDVSFLHMLGFHRGAFMDLHSTFVVEDPAVHAEYLASLGPHRTKRGRPPACDSFTLLAVGLYYLVNRCQQKVRLLNHFRPSIIANECLAPGHAAHLWAYSSDFMSLYLAKPGDD